MKNLITLILTLCLAIFYIGCGESDTSDRDNSATVDDTTATTTDTKFLGNSIQITGTFVAASYDSTTKPVMNGFISDIKIAGKKTVSPATVYAYYNVDKWGNWDIYLSGMNSKGFEIFGISLNEVLAEENFFNSASAGAVAFIVNGDDGAIYEAKPDLKSTGGTVNLAVGITFPTAGKTYNGSFDLTLNFIGKTADVNALGN